MTFIGHLLSYNCISWGRLKSSLLILMMLLAVCPASAADAKKKGSSKSNQAAGKEFVVVLDAGHGGKDIGAVDNGAREKDINLSVALKVGELLKKKMKDTKVVFTRDDDTFVSLQGRADIANKSKAVLFVSIHTNSVDKSNKNRKSVSGTSVYALGLHKDDNNMNVARRENSVIELEGNFEQKYSGFDPSKDESYIIFEMAQKKNLAQSIKFANEVQRQMVDYAGRRDRGVHQAGFWVLWATSMPSVLIELDFICNPQQAKYMTSQKGVDEMAEAIYKAIKSYEEKYVSRKSIAAGTSRPVRADRSVEEIMAENRPAAATDTEAAAADRTSDAVAVAYAAKKPRNDVAYRSRSAESATASSAPAPTSRRPAYTSGPRRRRSARSAALAEQRSYAAGEIIVLSETDGYATVEMAKAEEKPAQKVADNNTKKGKKGKKGKKVSKKHVGQADMARAKFRTVYTIQLAASDEQLKGSNPLFQGFSPIYSFRENNKYKYTYGEASTREEIEPLLKKVKSKIPDAKVIKKMRSL